MNLVKENDVPALLLNGSHLSVMVGLPSSCNEDFASEVGSSTNVCLLSKSVWPLHQFAHALDTA